ncbi:MAG TPA: NAD(P)H-binding protein [Spirochaetia bacterium]|nr:NAD(P)H-binding protein [Spirochaetia bacterium]
MSKIVILGATGSLGRHVVQQAVAANHRVSVLTRSEPGVAAGIPESVVVHRADLSEMSASDLAAILGDHEVVINAAGNVAQGQRFVDLVDHIVSSLEQIPETERPVAWFLAGLGLLDIDGHGRKGVDVPMIGQNYWPHRSNYDRIRQTDLDWRILCPGPMVDERPLGLTRLRISLDRLPLDIPDKIQSMPDAVLLRFLRDHMSETVVPYQDAAALMLTNIAPGGEMSRHRVGLALPSEG